MEFIPSKYQIDFWDAIKKSNNNIFVSAVPGSGKTTSLVEGLKLVPRYKKTIFLAFSKAIQIELQKWVPDHVDCMTLHSLGYKALWRHYKARLKLTGYKTFQFSKDVVEGLKINNKPFKSNKDEIVYKFTISDLIDMARINLDTSIDGLYNVEQIYNILCKDGEVESAALVFEKLSVYNQKYHKEIEIDYVDMLYLPIQFNMDLPKYDFVAVDECFPYNQKLATDKGKVKIGTLVSLFNDKKELPLVLSYNEKLNIFEYKPITNVWSQGKKELVQLSLGAKRKIKCTPGHKLLSIDGWKNAGDFKDGDIVLSNVPDQPYSAILNNDQEQIFLASKIGDGSIKRVSKHSYRSSIIHGGTQKDYLFWKARMFNCNNIEEISKNGYSQKKAFRFNTKTHIIKDSIFDAYVFIEKLDYRGISILFMDDGNFSESGNYSLYSSSTDKNRIFFLMDHINKIFDVNGVIKGYPSSSIGKIYYSIRYSVKDSIVISEKISPYIHDIFKYKINPIHYHKIGRYKWNNDFIHHGGMVVTSKKKLPVKEEVFDIEVKDNHNFIITSTSIVNEKTLNGSSGGFIAHNCQDLNPAQLELISRILKPKTGRLIAVGEKLQSIFAFQGASVDSVDKIKNRFDMKEYPLSITYRLPKIGVRNLKRLNHNLEGSETAIEGKIIHNSNLSCCEEGDIVICRNTKPLIVAYFILLEQEKKVTIVGKEMEKGLLKLIKSYEGLNSNGVRYTIEKEKEEIINVLIDQGISEPEKHWKFIIFDEKTEILLLFLDRYKKMPLVKEKIEEIFDEEKPGIKLMTVHKSKGLEADRVFFITHFNNDELIPSKYAVTPEQKQQERNLLYVGESRFKKEMHYIKLKNTNSLTKDIN